MMGFGGFGKKAAPTKAKVDVAKLDKTKRPSDVAGPSAPPPAASSSSKLEDQQPEAGSSASGSSAAQPEASTSSSAAPQPASDAEDDDDDDFSEPEEEVDFLPITHEISWKDHGKVSSSDLEASRRMSSPHAFLVARLRTRSRLGRSENCDWIARLRRQALRLRRDDRGRKWLQAVLELRACWQLPREPNLFIP